MRLKTIHLPVYFERREKDLVIQASKICSLSQGSFVRTAAMREARKVISEDAESK